MAASDHLRADLAQVTLGAYDVLAELGQGGMGTVFLAHDLALDRPVAIKVMAPHLMANPGMAARFLQEARIAASLSHPGIIPIYAVRQHQILLYFVMRYVQGRSLDAVLAARGRLAPAAVRSLLTQIGGALAYAHRNGVVHRDVKPSNVLVDVEGHAVVTDFGIAKAATSTSGATATGGTLGTPAYMSPEQCRGGTVDGASDQYSLGVLLYELLAGQLPFRGESPLALMYAQVNEAPPPLAEARPDCPAPLADAVMRMLAKEPAARWASLADAIAAVGGAAGPAGGEPALPELGDPALAEIGAAVGAGLALPEVRGRTPVSLAGLARFTDPALSMPGLGAARAASAAAPGLGELEIVPLGRTLTVGQRATLRLRWRGRPSELTGEIRWRSSAPDVLEVSPSGVLTAQGPGSATIAATTPEGAGVESVFSVTRVGVARVRLVAPVAAVTAGGELHLEATALDQLGSRLDGRVIEWRTSAPDIAWISPTGLLQARHAGAVEIVAACGDADASCMLRVMPVVVAGVRITLPPLPLHVGDRLQLAAQGVDQQNRPVRDEEPQWESSNPEIVAVAPDGRAEALRPGAVRIAATIAGKRATATLSVYPSTLAGAPTPAPASASVLRTGGRGTV